jgi:hypothetical protein
MAKALRTAIRAFVYELVVMGVIYYGLIVMKAMTKQVNYVALGILLLILFFGQWIYFYYKQSNEQ